MFFDKMKRSPHYVKSEVESYCTKTDHSVSYERNVYVKGNEEGKVKEISRKLTY